MNPAYDQPQLSLAVNFEDPSRNLDNAIQVADYFRFGLGNRQQFCQQPSQFYPYLAFHKNKYLLTRNLIYQLFVKY